jgi:hypothetical protein
VAVDAEDVGAGLGHQDGSLGHVGGSGQGQPGDGGASGLCDEEQDQSWRGDEKIYRPSDYRPITKSKSKSVLARNLPYLHGEEGEPELVPAAEHGKGLAGPGGAVGGHGAVVAVEDGAWGHLVKRRPPAISQLS